MRLEVRLCGLFQWFARTFVPSFARSFIRSFVGALHCGCARNSNAKLARNEERPAKLLSRPNFKASRSAAYYYRLDAAANVPCRRLIAAPEENETRGARLTLAWRSMIIFESSSERERGATISIRLGARVLRGARVAPHAGFGRLAN